MSAHTKPKKDFLTELYPGFKGLTNAEISASLEKYGKNELKATKGKSILRMIFEELKQFLNILLKI